METQARTVAKAVCWTLMGMAVMCLSALALTGSIALGGAMAVINSAVGLVTYFLYERLWARISWGRD